MARAVHCASSPVEPGACTLWVLGRVTGAVRALETPFPVPVCTGVLARFPFRSGKMWEVEWWPQRPWAPTEATAGGWAKAAAGPRRTLSGVVAATFPPSPSSHVHLGLAVCQLAVFVSIQIQTAKERGPVFWSVSSPRKLSLEGTNQCPPPPHASETLPSEL